MKGQSSEEGHRTRLCRGKKICQKSENALRISQNISEAEDRH